MEGKEEWINQLQQWLRQADQRIREVPEIQLYVAIAVLVLTSALFLLVRLLKRTRSNTIVLAGLSGSGKTVLFYQLISDSTTFLIITCGRSGCDNVGREVCMHEVMKRDSILTRGFEELTPQMAAMQQQPEFIRSLSSHNVKDEDDGKGEIPFAKQRICAGNSPHDFHRWKSWLPIKIPECRSEEFVASSVLSLEVKRNCFVNWNLPPIYDEYPDEDLDVYETKDLVVGGNFDELRDGSSHEGTVTSMDPNEDSFVLHSESAKIGKLKLVHVIDVPGHSRLRTKLDEYLPQAAGLVFVVDALDFLPNCRGAAEYLYDILTKASVVKKKIPVLILCNKTDKVTAHTKEFIKKQLEKEIDKLRTSRTAISEADIVNEYTLGVVDKPFSFSQCHNKVTVADSSGLTGQTSELEQFIRQCVRP